MLTWLHLVLRKRAVSVLLSASLIILSVLFIVNYRYSLAVEQELARLRTAGAPLNRCCFRPPLVRWENNAAPFYTAAIELANVGGYDLQFDKSIDAMLSSTPRERIDNILQQRASMLALLAEAHSREGFHLQPMRDATAIGDTQVWESVRYMVSVAGVKAMIDVNEGHVTDALRTSSGALHFETLFNSGSGLADEYMLSYDIDLTLQPLEKLAEGGVRGDYTTIIADLRAARHARAAALLTAVENERSKMIDIYARVRDDELTREESECVKYVTGKDSCLALVERPLFYQLLPLDEYYYLQDMNSIIDTVRAARMDDATDATLAPDKVVARRTAVENALDIEEGPCPSFLRLSHVFEPRARYAFKSVDEIRYRIDALVARLQALNR